MTDPRKPIHRPDTETQDVIRDIAHAHLLECTSLGAPSECSFATSTKMIPPELPSLDWVIVGGESGRNARPMHPDWARSLRDQCVAAGVPFSFKQWGEFRPPMTEADHQSVREGKAIGGSLMLNGTFGNPYGNAVVKVGKKAAGRHLDGRTWDQMPEVRNG